MFNIGTNWTACQPPSLSTTSHPGTYHTGYSNSSSHYPHIPISNVSSHTPRTTHLSTYCPSPPLGKQYVAQHLVPCKCLHITRSPRARMYSDHCQWCLSKSPWPSIGQVKVLYLAQLTKYTLVLLRCMVYWQPLDSCWTVSPNFPIQTKNYHRYKYVAITSVSSWESPTRLINKLTQTTQSLTNMESIRPFKPWLKL